VIAPSVPQSGVFAEGVPSLAAGGDGLGMSHEVESEVEDMDSDIYERSAPLFFLIDENAPSRDAATAEGLGTGVVNIAHMAGVDELLHEDAGAGKAKLEAHLEDFSGIAGGAAHLLGLFRIHGQGFFAKNVLPRFQGLDGGEGVKSVRSGDGDGIDGG